MTTRSVRTRVHAADRAELAARRAIAHYGGMVTKRAPAKPARSANATVNDRGDTQAAGSGQQILRRWSVAELIAGATWRRAVA
jgi:hypothetical protein